MDDGGFNVGYVATGEFLRYTLDVTKKSAGSETSGLRSFVVVMFSAVIVLRKG